MNKTAFRVLFAMLFIFTVAGCSSGSNTNQDAGVDGSVTSDSGVPDRGPHLIFSTYIGGSQKCAGCLDAFTFALNSASDSSGNTYVTGLTQVRDLPVKSAFQSQPATGSTQSAFVMKYDTTGQILWGTYLGGDNQSIGIGIAAMPGGGVAVSGITTSDSGPFPVKNAFQSANNGNGDYFVAVFDKDGNLQYSTLLGGSEAEGEAGVQFADNSSNGNNLAADSSGLLYLTGITASGGIGVTTLFPTTSNAVQPAFGGEIDAFLAIIDPTKTGSASLLYSSFIGGSGNEKGHGITANSGGSAVTVVGYTDSADFPTTSNGYRSTPATSGFQSNGFVAQFSSSAPGSTSATYAKAYATYLGGILGKPRDDAYGVTQDKNGLILITGRTQSADFPMLDSTHPSIYNTATYLSPGVSNDEPYLTKLNPTKSGAASLVYSTFLGGGSTSGGGGGFCTVVAVDQSGNAYVAGETSASGTLYTYSPTPGPAPQATPYTADAYMNSYQGNTDVLLMEVSAQGSTLSYSTFLGGPENDRAYGMAIDPSGNFIVSGLSYSANFPVKNPAQQYPGNTGKMNGFVTKMGR
ncbi:MAG: hypothetical protein WC889_17300 [Myxococcota bacterium]